MNGVAPRNALVVLLAAAALAPGGARAEPACIFGTSTALAFGTYDPLSSLPADSTSTLSYRCPRNPPPLRILIDRGLTGSYAARELRQGAEVLLYNVYLDAQRTIVWGDGTDGSRVGPMITTQGDGGTLSVYVFGRIPAGQDAVAGVYADTLRVSFEM